MSDVEVSDMPSLRTLAGSGWRTAFIGVGLGAVLGCAWASVEIAQDHYLEQNLKMLAWRGCRDTATSGAVLGVILAGVVAGLRCLGSAEGIRGAVNRFFGGPSPGDGPASKGAGPWPCMIALGGAGIALLIRSLWVESIGSFVLWGVLGGSLLWCVAFGLSRPKRRGRAEARPANRSVRAVLYVALLLLVVAGAAVTQAAVRRWWVHGLACAVLFLLLFASTLRRGGRGSDDGGGSTRSKRAGKVAVAGCALLGVLWVASPAVTRSQPGPAQPWNVILIGIDTLRLDHVGLPGAPAYERDLTPHLRQLAARGCSFSHAISQAPWTMPAFASIFTGRYPQEHGAVSLLGRLRQEEICLAEVLANAGYATGAVVTHVYVDREHGFAQGFDSFDQQYSVGHHAITSRGVTDEGIKFIEERSSDPFFLFLHYFDPHYEYRDHPDETYADAYEGWLLLEPNAINNLRRKRHLLAQDDIQYLVDLYDEEIAYTDREIGRLMQRVERLGLAENTLIVVVADHGEEFMERGWLGHSITMHEEVIRVPLLIVLPDGTGAGRLVEDLVETRSVFTTVLDVLGIAIPPTTSAPSLLSKMQVPTSNAATPQADAQEGDADAAYSCVWLPDASIRSGKRVMLSSVHHDDWKLIFDHAHERARLFNLRDDPRETTDLASEHPEKCAELLRLLDEWWEEVGENFRTETGPTPGQGELGKLESLGYF